MRAWLLDSFSGLRALRQAELPEPVAAPREVVLSVHYAALNPADRYLAERQYPATPLLPHVLGRDGLGKVVALGSEVSGVAIGDRRIILRGDVGVLRQGTFAERVAVPVDSLAEVPPGWQEAEAAAAPLVYLTAHQALTMWGPLPTGGVVLVTGASGGVGVATIQLAVALGHTVVALSRSESKRTRLRGLGAHLCLDPAAASWRKELGRELAARRVSLAVDTVGGPLLPEVIATLGEGGRVSLVGGLAGPVPSFNTASLFFRRLRLGGVAVGASPTGERQAAWREVLALLESTGARPLVDSVWPFARLPEAFACLEAGPLGKVLLAIGAVA